MKTQIKQIPAYFIDENKVVYNDKGDVITEEKGIVRLMHEGLRRRFKVVDLTPLTDGKILDVEGMPIKDAPKDLPQIEKAPKVKKEKRDLSKSNKAIVYQQWKAGETDNDKLLLLVDNKVKIVTIKMWCNQWKKGNNLPAIAK